MNTALTIIGAILLILGLIFVIFTFFIGIICAWPLLLVGLIFLILGLALPNQKTETYPQQSQQTPQGGGRVCPNCGRPIPMDANICPYCGKKFM